MPSLPDRSLGENGKPIAGAILTPSTNLTLGGVTLAGAATVVAAWQTLFEQIFGTSATEATRKDVLIASLFGLAIIIAADLFARAITSAAAERSKSAAVASTQWIVSPAPMGLSVTLLDHEDESGYKVAALRSKPAEPEVIEYLLVKGKKAPAWKSASALKFE